MRDIVAPEYYSACVRMLEPSGEAQQRCLTAAAGAKQREEFRRMHCQAEVSKNGLPIKALGDALKFKNRRHSNGWKARTVVLTRQAANGEFVSVRLQSGETDLLLVIDYFLLSILKDRPLYR